jgi:hypothetical protein
MVFDDHAPPHFHVRYAEPQAQINIQTLGPFMVQCPGAISMVQEWGRLHQTELMETWNLSAQMQSPNKSLPLP